MYDRLRARLLRELGFDGSLDGTAGTVQVLPSHLLDLERVDLLHQLRHLVLALLELVLLPLPVLLLGLAVLLL